jgi:hypothetical protein
MKRECRNRRKTEKIAGEKGKQKGEEEAEGRRGSRREKESNPR